MPISSPIPEPGFYYHYKHDPHGPLNHHAYRVLGTGEHSEENCRPEDKYMVVYRALYEDARAYQNEKLFDIRPLAMFMEDVTKGDATFPRFRKITNPEIIAKLEEIEKEMYR
jgi:hypothetical protein